MVRRAVRHVVPLALLVATGCAGGRQADLYRTVPANTAHRMDSAVKANERGLTLVQQADYATAERAFRQALRLDPSNTAAHNNLGLVLSLPPQRQLYASALELALAAKLDPLAPAPRINLGRLYETIGWHKAAAAEYEKVLAIDGGNAEATERLAHLYIQVGQQPERVPRLLEALARNDQDRAWQSWAVRQLNEARSVKP